MAELHPHTGTPLCGCGAHHCYVRRRLDDIRALAELKRQLEEESDE